MRDVQKVIAALASPVRREILALVWDRELRAGEIAAAILLPLYYGADATLTLVRRIATGEPFWQAHRSHFYQRACDMGFSVPAIVGRVSTTKGRSAPPASSSNG